MFDALTYQEMLKEIKKNSEKYGITDDVVAILITRPDLATGKDILNSLEYYHFRTGHSINFYLPGYGAYWTEEEYPDGKVVAEIASVKWSFSNQCFVKFIEDMEKYSKWRYSGESDLIFAEVKNGILSYERAMEFHLDNMLRDKSIISVNQFFEKIVRIGQEGRSMNQIGNKLGIDKGKQVVFDALLEKMPMHVELQADVALGLDDVVITYMDGHKKFVQVKHTRANDTLTFGDLVTIDTSNVDANSHISLLGELAKSWNEEHSKYSTTDILLFSNRKKGKRIAHAGPQSSIKRPALNWFIDDLSKQLETVKKYNELVFPGYELAWEEWKKQLEYIPNDDKKLEFLKHLSISTDQEELEALGETLIEKLKNTFKTNDEIARLLFVRLDHALRKWTTSIRDSSIVSVEDVLRELSIEDDIISYNHDLIPSVPFFESRLSVVEDIEKALSCPQNRVVFLSGIPGTGKTNIISKLSGKRNSIVNIRYYAYEPIDPQKEYLPKDVSRRVDNSVFWNELFNQLRRQLLGKLSKYRVPVINNLLPQEQLRSEFFRIAAEYAQDENSLFIVAIDGIDHAARANVSENTFLSALPNPEYLPENVKIVIAGQPKEDYRNYPEWLFNNEMGYVKEIHVPSILKSDIYSLVENKFPEMDNVFKNQLTNVVCRYADGNTLSAIFAVHEATQCNDIVALEQRLTDRKLSGNIQEYYKAIWDSAKAKFQIPFVDYKMAGVFAFFNEPLNEYKLQKIFSEEGISISVWRNVLKSMRPLLVETNGNYTILHNDIRVYLSRIIGRDNDWIEEVYSFLASYYINLSEEEKGYSYYNDVLRFLIYAKRASEFKNIFTPDFIISSFVYGIGINEIYSRANDFLKRTIDENVIDWEQMKCLAFGYLTIDQIEKSQNEIEGANFRTTNQYIPVNSYECYVKPLASWNSEIITSVLSLASDLIDNNHADRAEALLYNWFYDVTLEYYEQMIHEYVQDKSYSSTAILEACESLHNKDALKESVVLEIMEHEFFKESSSIERNSLLEYLISFGKAEETDVLIRKYLGMLLQRDHYYCALDVPALVLWKMKQLSPEYGINGMKQILDMHRSWRTAAGHIKDVELTNEIIFTKLVDWNESTDLYTLFLDIALLLIKSEDADVARTALAGVFATLRVEPGYINFIEKMWDSFHYRAKEWILMIYELLWDYREDFHDNMLTILKKHCEDEDFNVSLYSNLLLENYSSDDSFKYIRNSKSYFDEIPNRGHKLFIKKNRPSPWINGYDCVMEQIELLSERLEVDGEHLEKRVADYCDKIPDTVQLIKLGRKWRGCRVVCENPNRSFLRVLYKDWYNHKFDWEETELGRIVLSASEPYCLLITPQLWTYNNGYLLNPPESFISSSSVEQKKQIHDILFEGVDDTETVLAGGIIDYTHKEEIFGFMVSYFSIPGLPSKYAAHCYERNSRLLLQSRPDFSEQEHYNITLHHNGIESFQGSNIMCGFSKISLDEFHWHINITVNGMRLFNEGGQEIGRFEYYYGQRGNMGNRYISNQPLLQRWVVSKDAISKARCIVGCPNNIKINHAFDSVIRKYED